MRTCFFGICLRNGENLKSLKTQEYFDAELLLNSNRIYSVWIP